MTNWEKLKEPFAADDIEWRVSRAGKKNSGGLWAKVLAYITARAIQERLDEVFGPDGWKNEFREGPAGGVLCRILFKTEDGEWCWREDGADNTDIEGVKGGLSSALKRAGAALGIGRYLYNLPEGWAQINADGQYYGRLPKDKGGDSFRWDPPDLPAWALPAGASGGSKTTEKPDRPAFEDLPQGKAKNGNSKPETNEVPAGEWDPNTSAATNFWSLAKKLKLSQEEAEEIKDAEGGNFRHAFDRLVVEHVPPEEEAA